MNTNQNLTFTCNGNAVEVRGNQVYGQAGEPFITNTGNENIIRQS